MGGEACDLEAIKERMIWGGNTTIFAVVQKVPWVPPGRRSNFLECTGKDD